MRDSYDLKISTLVVAALLGVVKDAHCATKEVLIIARGEQRDVALNQLKNFSVGNKEVISCRLHKGKLLVKGTQVGFSDLIIWEKTGVRQVQVYVLSKTAFLKTTQLAETLQGLGLQLELKGAFMLVTGPLTKLRDWNYLQHMRRLHQDKVIFQLETSPELRRELIAAVYRELFSNGITRVVCRVVSLDLDCRHESRDVPKGIIASLQERYGVRFIQGESRWNQMNLRLRLKLIQIESSQGTEISFGLSALRANPLDLFEHGLKKLIADNQVALAAHHIQLSTLAEPETLVLLNQPHAIEIGAQIPFQNISHNQGVVLAPIDWKFAGLKLITQLSERDGQLVMNYETEFTRPSAENISGSREKSSLLIKPGVVYKLFQIGYQSRGDDRKFLPGLGEIPILRVLFGAHGEQVTYKRIEGYLIIDEVL